MIDLVLVNPNGRNPAPFAAIEPPLWLGLIAGKGMSQGLFVEVIDAEAYNLDTETILNWIVAYHPEAVEIVVMGNNPSVSSTPKWSITEQLLKELNKVYFGAVYVTGLHPLAVYKNEKLKYFNIKQLQKLAELPWHVDFTKCDGYSVPWSKFDLSKYRAHNWHCLDDVDKRSPYAVLYTSLNCPHSCFYCNVHTLYGDRKVRYRPLEDVFKELDYFAEKGIRNIKIWDECFTTNPDRVKKICDYIIANAYDFNMWAYCRLDQVEPVMLSKMWLAGIKWLAYGFESTGDSKFKEAMMATELTRETGHYIIGNFMFGLPSETVENWKASLDFAMQQNFEWANFQVALPYPGSAWYDGLKEKPTDWARFSQFHTNMYGNKEAIKFREYAFRTYFNRPEYLEMIESRFNEKAKNHVLEMLKWKIK